MKNVILNYIFRNIDSINHELNKNHDCNLSYRNLKRSNNLWNKIFQIDIQRKYVSNKYKRVFSKNNSLFFLFLIKINSKFKFSFIKKYYELIHLILESNRLVFEINKKNNVTIFEKNIFNYSKNSIAFYPSLKKLLSQKSILFLVKIVIVNKFLITKGTDLKISKHLNSRFNIYNFLIIKSIILLESEIKKINKVQVGGTMNLFNRILSLIAINNNIDVEYKDHGFVRDCCAEYGIFTKSIPYPGSNIKSKLEKNIYVK